MAAEHRDRRTSWARDCAIGHAAGLPYSPPRMRTTWPMRSAIGCRLLIALAVTSTAPPALTQESTTPLARGEALLTANCARCHAVGRAGDSPHATAPMFR